jgi:hypothetical protein
LQPARPQTFSRKFADAETYQKRATPFPSRVKHTAFNLQEAQAPKKRVSILKWNKPGGVFLSSAMQRARVNTQILSLF